jgi:competence protein ComEA
MRNRSPEPGSAADDARLACAGALVLFAVAAAGWVRGGTDAGPPPRPAPYLVDLNAAPAGEIEALPGVGRVLAERIVAARADGPFARPEDVTRVPGVGPTTLARMRPFVRWGDGR